MNCFAAALLAGSLSTEAWAQSTSASSRSTASRQELPEQLQTALRKMVTAMLLASVKESKMGAQSITAFSKETDRVLAATAMNDVVTRICRNTLPQISAADRIRAESVCP